MVEPGTLYIVATPIGNLEDITLRALRILKEVDFIYAEDTRQSRKLCDRHSIGTPLRSYREAAEPRMLERVFSDALHLLGEGKSLAYVSDAGTPGVSDPGSYLVRKVTEAGFKAVPIPGPSALAAVISTSGLPCARPLFVGFLPKKKGHQTLMRNLKAALESEAADSLVFYESPERITKLLQELIEWEIPLEVCLGRELTKQFEESLRGPIAEVLTTLAARKTIKGEIVLIVTPS
jgi:16S rRNA (cytidine1402-2'-O)-methyltransferase